MHLTDYYIFPDRIDADTHAWIYRSIRYRDQCPILLKCLKRSSPSIADLKRLQNEYDMTQMMDHPGIVRSIDLLHHHDQSILLLADNGSVPIEFYPFDWEGGTYCWGQGDPIPIELFWAIAVQLVEILDCLEMHYITLPELLPHNLWIHPSTYTLTLMNLEKASLSTQEMLPDYQVLGTVFYELLTGIRLGGQNQPICSPDRLNSCIPSMLSRIVMKLLSPSPATSYQSAQGIRYDLARCQLEQQTNGYIANFELGTEERPDRFRVRDRLYGREMEVATIVALFDKISSHPTKVLLQISGASGIGKTAIVTQFKPSRGYVIRGKFDQVNRQFPFSAILQALRDLIDQWLSESKSQIAARKQRLLNALDLDAQVILGILPELAQIIGSQPAVAVLTGDASGNRFSLVLRRLIRVLASGDDPLVLFLDDVQWADRASLDVILQWLTDDLLQHFFCIVAYRDHEVSPSHPVMLMLADLQTREVQITALSIAPLAQSAINQLVSDTLHCDESLSRPLGQEIWGKTQGNPFFSIQLFTAFYQDGYLAYDPVDRCWQCDLSRVRAAHISEDVVDFMIDRLMRLVTATRSILSWAACLGNEFDVATLAIVSGQSELTVASKLWRALQEGLVIPVNHLYKFQASSSASFPNLVSYTEVESVFGTVFGTVFEFSRYQFLHDRVQQAAYHLIALRNQPMMHLSIGRRLQATLRSQLDKHTLSDRQLFDLVGQFNQGLNALEDPDEQLMIAKLNLTAAQRAATTTAYQSALNYAKVGLSLLPVDRWTLHERLTRSLYELAAETAYLSGEFDQTPAFIGVLQQHSRSVIEGARADEIQMQAYAAEGKPLATVELALVALEKLGFTIAHNPNPFQMAIAIVKLHWIFMRRSSDHFVTLPKMTDEKVITIARVLNALSYLVVLSSPKLLPSVTLISIEIALKSGYSIYSIYAYLGSAIIFSSVFKQINLSYKVGQIAMRLLDRDDEKMIEPRIKVALSIFVNHWKLPLREVVRLVQPAYQESLKIGDLDSAAWAFHSYAYHQYYAGFDLVALEQEFQESMPLIKQFNQVGAWRFIQHTYQVILMLRGSFSPHSNLAESETLEMLFRSAQSVNSRTELFAFYFNRGKICYLFGDYEKAYQFMQSAYLYRDAAMSLFTFGLCQFYTALTMAAYHDIASPHQHRQLRQIIRRSQKFLDRSMKDCSENYANKYYLVKAEYARIKGDRLTAINAYERAIAFAQRHQLTHELALAYELAARFYAQWKQELIAQLYMKKAYDAYENWGATAKLEQLKYSYPFLLPTIE